MADRKMTVLNPAGYQEILQTGDQLVVDSNEVKFGNSTEIGFFGAAAVLQQSASEQTVAGVIDSIRSALNTLGLTDIQVEGDYTQDLQDLMTYLNNPIDIIGTAPIVVTEPTSPSSVSSITIGGATSNQVDGTYTDVATINRSGGGSNDLRITFDVESSAISDIVITTAGTDYTAGETFELNGHGGSTQMTVASVGVNVYTISVNDATTSDKGVVRVGDRLSVDNGTISADIATNSSLGAVRPGNGLSISSGIISVDFATTNDVQQGTEDDEAIAPDTLKANLNEESEEIPGADSGYTVDCGIYFGTTDAEIGAVRVIGYDPNGNSVLSGDSIPWGTSITFSAVNSGAASPVSYTYAPDNIQVLVGGPDLNILTFATDVSGSTENITITATSPSHVDVTLSFTITVLPQ